MSVNTFIPECEALRRYGRSDRRTLRSWAKRGYLLYQVINPESPRPEWMFESPEARYERTMGIV